MTSRTQSAATTGYKQIYQMLSERAARMLSMRLVLTVAFTLIAFVPSLFLSGWVERTVLTHEIDAVKEKHLLLAKNAQLALQRYADDVETGFDLFIDAVQHDETSHHLKQVAKRLKFRSLAIYNPNAEPVRSWNVSAVGHATIDDETLREIVSSAPSTGTKFLPAQLDSLGRPTIYIACKLANGDVAIGTLSNEFIKKIQHSITFDQRGHAAIVDSEGQLLAHPKPEWTQTIKNIAKIEPVARMMRGESGVMQFYSPAVKANMIAGYTSVPGVGWGVMVPQPFAELQARADRITQAAYISISLGVAIAAVFAWFLAGLLVRPVYAVINGTTKIAGGSLAFRVPTHSRIVPRELRSLSENFNDMAEEIEAHHAAQTAKAEEERRQLLGRIAENLPGVIFRRVVNTDGCVEYPVLNMGTQKAFGLDRKSIGSDPAIFVDAIVPEDRDIWSAMVEGTMTSSDTNYRDIRIKHQDGHVFFARLFGTVRHQEGTIVWDGGAIDVTQEKSNEQRLVQNQKMQALGKLTGGVAHDFNNLLAIIIGHLELVDEKLNDSDSIRPLTRIAINAAEKGAELTSRLLAYTRNQELQPRVVNLCDLLENMQDMVVRSIGENIEVTYEQGSGPCFIKIDPGQMENAVLNLVVNARSAMPGGGMIKLQTSQVSVENERIQQNLELPSGNYVCLTVSDNGEGIEPDDLCRVFEPFFTTRKDNEGHGLGLSMIHGFVRQSGGDVTIESVPNFGTTVNIYLPICDAHLEDHPDTYEQEDTTERQAAGSILLIEDEVVVGDICNHFLEQLGYNVVRAETGEAALRKLRDHNFMFRGIVSDVVLPGKISGPQVVEYALKENPDLGVLMMSGYPEDHCKTLLSECPRAVYLRKPFRKKIFADQISIAMEAHGVLPPDVLDAERKSHLTLVKI
ncbi:MAG: ATP-binding protein [Paracoccaceae bacterium]